MISMTIRSGRKDPKSLMEYLYGRSILPRIIQGCLGLLNAVKLCPDAPPVSSG
jgi:hypothetical protein